MKNQRVTEENDKVNGRAAVAFVVAVLVIGSSCILPPAYFGDSGPTVDYEFTDVNGNSTHVYRQTGRYLKAPERLSNGS